MLYLLIDELTVFKSLEDYPAGYLITSYSAWHVHTSKFNRNKIQHVTRYMHTLHEDC